eukprot:gene10428-8378_t
MPLFPVLQTLSSLNSLNTVLQTLKSLYPKNCVADPKLSSHPLAAQQAAALPSKSRPKSAAAAAAAVAAPQRTSTTVAASPSKKAQAVQPSIGRAAGGSSPTKSRPKSAAAAAAPQRTSTTVAASPAKKPTGWIPITSGGGAARKSGPVPENAPAEYSVEKSEVTTLEQHRRALQRSLVGEKVQLGDVLRQQKRALLAAQLQESKLVEEALILAPDI